MTDGGYHWSPANQRAFLEHLAEHGSVRQASAAVSMAEGSAYRLRRRREGTAFAIGWDAALQIARAKLRADLMDRALYGQEDVAVRHKDEESGDVRTVRQRKDNRLAMWMLTSIDMHVAAQGDLEAALSRLVAQDFDAFLRLIEAEGDALDMIEFIEQQMSVRSAAKQAHEYDLSQFCAIFRIEAQSEEETEDDYANDRHDVWQDDDGGWSTNYPPPPGFAGFEQGAYGDYHYRRALTARETAIALADQEEIAADYAAEREAACQARDRYFGFVPEPCEAQPASADNSDEEEDLAALFKPLPMNRKMRRTAAALAAKKDGYAGRAAG